MNSATPLTSDRSRRNVHLPRTFPSANYCENARYSQTRLENDDMYEDLNNTESKVRPQLIVSTPTTDTPRPTPGGHVFFSGDDYLDHTSPSRINDLIRGQNAGRHVHKQKEPQTFDGVTDFQDYILHFEQVAKWNGWNDHEKAQQLSMCLRGNAQKVLADLTLNQINHYSEIRSALMQRLILPEDKLHIDVTSDTDDAKSQRLWHNTGIACVA